jgi:hypothetical protein
MRLYLGFYKKYSAECDRKRIEQLYADLEDNVHTLTPKTKACVLRAMAEVAQQQGNPARAARYTALALGELPQRQALESTQL